MKDLLICVLATIQVVGVIFYIDKRRSRRTRPNTTTSRYTFDQAMTETFSNGR